MAKAKKKKLPKDFDEILQAGDFEAFKAVFESCDVNAYGGYGKEPHWQNAGNARRVGRNGW